MSPFNADAVLIRHNGRGRRPVHQARLGLLLNCVKRMRIPPATEIEIICGDTLCRHTDIVALLNSQAYQDWLSAPRARRAR